MRDKGFTLIEIITVFSLIGIILAISVPRIDTDFGYIDSMTREFLMDVRTIQMNSMKNPNNKYQIEVIAGQRKYNFKNGINIIKTISFKEGYKISYTGLGALYFKNDGTPVNAGTFTITDTKTNNSKGVSIVPATGRTIILE